MELARYFFNFKTKLRIANNEGHTTIINKKKLNEILSKTFIKKLVSY